MRLLTKRVHDEPSEDDGWRVLVDRLWPRGLSKEAARVDLWAKEVAPSHELRRWFHEEPAERWEEFRARYRMELEEKAETIESLRNGLRVHPKATLLFGVRDVERNHAAILREHLDQGQPRHD